MCSQSIYIIVILWVCDTEKHVSQALFSCLNTKHMARSGMNLYSVGHIYLLTCGVGRWCLYFPVLSSHSQKELQSRLQRIFRKTASLFADLPCLQNNSSPFYIRLELR